MSEPAACGRVMNNSKLGTRHVLDPRMWTLMLVGQTTPGVSEKHTYSQYDLYDSTKRITGLSLAGVHHSDH